MAGTDPWSITLRIIQPEDVTKLQLSPLDEATMTGAAAIIREVREGGEAGLLSTAHRFGDLAPGDKTYMLSRADMAAAFESLPAGQQALLRRVEARIRTFAQAQRDSLSDLTVTIPGGTAGHTVRSRWRVDCDLCRESGAFCKSFAENTYLSTSLQIAPVAVAGCYAPGGRYPLPSSVLMTAVTARVAGVHTVVVASPRPATITIAAAHVAGADYMLSVGGAQAIAAMAHGAGVVPRCDVIVGPGNRWVTAAKSLLCGVVGIDMLAGPSECLVLADSTADAALIAADLLAQAEHDPDALPVLVTTAPELVQAVSTELSSQLARLSTRDTAAASMRKGFAVVCPDLATAISVVDTLAPEHLEVQVADADAVWRRVSNYGAMFIGANTAEVFGDYGAGPNHVLPTSGTSRFTGGLSVFTFLVRCSTCMRVFRHTFATSVRLLPLHCGRHHVPLAPHCPLQRVRTWLRSDATITAGKDVAAFRSLVEDTAALAELEGLAGHAAAAIARKKAVATE